VGKLRCDALFLPMQFDESHFMFNTTTNAGTNTILILDIILRIIIAVIIVIDAVVASFAVPV
jgi:hypothetical protein